MIRKILDRSIIFYLIYNVVRVIWFFCSYFGSTPVFTGDGEGGSGFAAAAAAAAAGGGDFDFGVDPNLDPELALALRVSMEEERARQEAAAKRAADEAARQEKGEEPSSKSQDTTMVDKAAEATNSAADPMVGFILTHTFCIFVSVLLLDKACSMLSVWVHLSGFLI